MGKINSTDQDDIRGQLERILKSREFVAHERHSRLLSHIVNATLAYDTEALKARSIAIAVFERGNDFESSSDPVVRVEVAKLRGKLEKYYFSQPEAPIVIRIPKGGYATTFDRVGEGPQQGKLPEKEGAPLPQPPKADYNWTILILPFATSGEKDTAGQLVAGIVNEASIKLTRSYDLNVIDYNFYQQYSGAAKPVSPPLIKEHDNARFVLGGEAQVWGKHFKIWVFLRDGKTEYNLWSDKYEGSLEDKPAFKWQEEVSEAIVFKIAGEFGVISQARFSDYAQDASDTSLGEEAFLLYTKWASNMTEQNFQYARETAEKAATTYPENSTLQAILADLCISYYEYGRPGAEEYFEKGFQIASRAVAQDPRCQLAYLVMAFYHFSNNDHDNFLLYAQKAVDINPSNANTLFSLSASYAMLGMWDIAISYVEKVKALNPAYPNWGNAVYAFYHYFNRDYEAAFSHALRIAPATTIWNPLFRALSSAMLGNKEQTEQGMHDLLKIYPNFREKGRQILASFLSAPGYYEQLCEGLDSVEKLLA